MIIIAASLYLPAHVNEMLRRAWFYYAGDEAVVGTAGGARGVGVGAGAEKHIGGSGGARNGGKMAGQDVMDMLGSL